jgi:hypothetical protein
MSLFKKKEGKKELSSLPELPEMPRFPELPKDTMPSLPAFQFIPPPRFEEIRIPSQKPMTMEIREAPSLPEMPEPEMLEMPKFHMPEMPESRPREPIFVKIDKYREAIMQLEIIKRKLHETSNLLEKIKDTRAKEGEELNVWMNEINTIKEKIGIIDKKLFSA